MPELQKILCSDPYDAALFCVSVFTVPGQAALKTLTNTLSLLSFISNGQLPNFKLYINT